MAGIPLAMDALTQLAAEHADFIEKLTEALADDRRGGHDLVAESES